MNLNNRKTHRGAYFEYGVGKVTLSPPPPTTSGVYVFRYTIMCSYCLPIMIVTAYI